MIGDGGGDESGTADGGATGGQETLVNKVVLKCTSSLFTKERETTNVTFVTKLLEKRHIFLSPLPIFFSAPAIFFGSPA